MNARQQRSWRFPARLISNHSIFAVGLWAVFVVVIAGIIVGANYFDTITSSIWDPAATQVVRWYMLFIGFYLSSTLLPVYIAHGKTRRDFAIEASIFTACLSALGAALVIGGYGLEAVLYRIMDWPQEIGGNHWFSSLDQVPLIFAEFWLMFLIWILGGAFIAAAFYRSSIAGVTAILVGMIVAGMVDIALGGSWGPLGSVIEGIFGSTSMPASPSVVMILGSILIFVGLNWAMIRDIAVKSK